MRLLQIDDNTRKDILKALQYAGAHRIDGLAARDGLIEPAGAVPEYVTHIHDGYRVVYSIESQPIGWCKHISISVEQSGSYPSPEAVMVILKEFGMDPDIEKSLTWVEEHYEAINILQPEEVPWKTKS